MKDQKRRQAEAAVDQAMNPVYSELDRSRMMADLANDPETAKAAAEYLSQKRGLSEEERKRWSETLGVTVVQAPEQQKSRNIKFNETLSRMGNNDIEDSGNRNTGISEEEIANKQFDGGKRFADAIDQVWNEADTRLEENRQKTLAEAEERRQRWADQMAGSGNNVSSWEERRQETLAEMETQRQQTFAEMHDSYSHIREDSIHMANAVDPGRYQEDTRSASGQGTLRAEPNIPAGRSVDHQDIGTPSNASREDAGTASGSNAGRATPSNAGRAQPPLSADAVEEDKVLSEMMTDFNAAMAGFESDLRNQYDSLRFESEAYANAVSVSAEQQELSEDAGFSRAEDFSNTRDYVGTVMAKAEQTVSEKQPVQEEKAAEPPEKEEKAVLAGEDRRETGSGSLGDVKPEIAAAEVKDTPQQGSDTPQQDDEWDIILTASVQNTPYYYYSFAKSNDPSVNFTFKFDENGPVDVLHYYKHPAYEKYYEEYSIFNGPRENLKESDLQALTGLASELNRSEFFDPSKLESMNASLSEYFKGQEGAVISERRLNIMKEMSGIMGQGPEYLPYLEQQMKYMQVLEQTRDSGVQTVEKISDLKDTQGRTGGMKRDDGEEH